MKYILTLLIFGISSFSFAKPTVEVFDISKTLKDARFLPKSLQLKSSLWNLCGTMTPDQIGNITTIELKRNKDFSFTLPNGSILQVKSQEAPAPQIDIAISIKGPATSFKADSITAISGGGIVLGRSSSNDGKPLIILVKVSNSAQQGAAANP